MTGLPAPPVIPARWAAAPEAAVQGAEVGEVVRDQVPAHLPRYQRQSLINSVQLNPL